MIERLVGIIDMEKIEMDYSLFKRQFDKLLKEKGKYPAAVSYMRESLLGIVSSTLISVLEQLERQTERNETFWEHLNQVISDVLYASQMNIKDIFNLNTPSLPENRDFQIVKENLYETPVYPIIEHLNYIDFEPALERVRYILKQLPKLKLERGKFCDLGFGPGVLMALTLEEKPDWMGYGVDISLSCGKYAQRLLEVREVSKRSIVSVADVRSLPYKDDVFQLIVGMEVFEHIANPEAGLLEAVRVLKPGGYAITALPVQLPLLMHLYVFKDVPEVLQLYHRVGLKVLDFEAKEFNLRQGKFIDTFALSIKE